MIPKGFRRLYPFFVSVPPRGSRTTSTPSGQTLTKQNKKPMQLVNEKMAHSHFGVKTKTGINLTFCWKKISSIANMNVSLINSPREE